MPNTWQEWLYNILWLPLSVGLFLLAIEHLLLGREASAFTVSLCTVGAGLVFVVLPLLIFLWPDLFSGYVFHLPPR